MASRFLLPPAIVLSVLAAAPAGAAVITRHECLYATMTYDDVQRSYHVWGTNPKSGKVIDMVTTHAMKAHFVYFITLHGK